MNLDSSQFARRAKTYTSVQMFLTVMQVPENVQS